MVTQLLYLLNIGILQIEVITEETCVGPGCLLIQGILVLYNNQINARALIGQSAVGYCAGKPTEKSPVFWIII